MEPEKTDSNKLMLNGDTDGTVQVISASEPTHVAMEMVVSSLGPADFDFGRLCDKLNLPDDVRKKGWGVYEQLKSKDSEEMKQIPAAELIACAVYIAVVDTRMPYGPGDPQLECGYLAEAVTTVTDLLTHANIRCTRLFHSLNVVGGSFSFSESVKYHLKYLEKKYCIVSALFHTFERLCVKVFREEQKEESASIPVPQTEGVDHRKKLCWLLFLHAKDHVSVDAQIVDAFYILICCLEYILRTTPAFQLNPPFDAVRINSIENTEVQGINQSMLQKLSEDLHCNFDEVSAVQSNITEPFIQSLKHHEGELDLTALLRVYQSNYTLEGDINELLFLNHDPHLQPDRNTQQQKCSTSDVPCEPPVTPIRVALNTIQQLKNMLSFASDEPSPSLKQFFLNCSVNPTASITARIQKLKSVFIQNFVDVCGQKQKALAEQRFILAQRLYYRVMETMLNAESERLSQTDFSRLLNIETFHVSLLACSMEIVLMTYDMSWIASRGAMGSGDSEFSFPWVLEAFQLHAYDFYKVLASFIKAEPVLTKEIVKHLQSLEIKILEELAWKADSPLFDAISNSEICHPTLPVSPDQSNGISASTAELYLSPMRPQTRGRVASPGQPLTPSPRKSPDNRPSPQRSQSLNIFLNKVCRLGYHRLQQLCALLAVPKDVQHKIWTCLECCITRKPALLRNRHLDQIMMCSLYGICKVMEREIKFKTIVQMFRELPHAEQHIYKNALIEGQEYDSIIAFYNKIFMHNMKTYILQFASSRPTPTLSPVPIPVSSPLTPPVYRIANRNHLYVSPLRDSPFKAPPSPSQMTPRSRQLYSFGEGIGSAEKLRNINETVFRAKNGSKPVTPKSLKRLNFFEKPDESMQSSDNQMLDDCAVIVKKKKVSQQEPVLSIQTERLSDVKNNNQESKK